MFSNINIFDKRQVKWLQTRKFQEKIPKCLEVVVKELRGSCSQLLLIRFQKIIRKMSFRELRPAADAYLELSRTSLSLSFSLANHRYCDNEDDFKLSRDFLRLRIPRVIWLYGQVPIQTNYHFPKFGSHSTKFGGQRHFDSASMILVCHVILQDHVIKGSSDFMERTP